MSAIFAKRLPSRSSGRALRGSRWSSHAGRCRTRGWRRSRTGSCRAGRCDTSACGRRSGRRGSAAARPGSSSPNLPRRAPRSAARREPSLRSSAVRRPSARARNKRGSANRRAGFRRARRRPAPAADVGEAARRLAPRLRPVRGCRRRVARKLITAAFPSPAARRAAWSACRIVLAGVRVIDLRLDAAAWTMSLADGCGVSRMSHGSAATFAMLARIGGQIGRMVAEAIGLSLLTGRQAVGIDDLPADAAVAAAPMPGQRARRVARRRRPR